MISFFIVADTKYNFVNFDCIGGYLTQWILHQILASETAVKSHCDPTDSTDTF